MRRKPTAADPPGDQLVFAALGRPNSGGVRRAQDLLRANPELPDRDVCGACVCGAVASVEKLLRKQPELAVASCGPLGWEPLLYAAHSRLGTGERQEDMARVARLLIQAGADPNAVLTWRTREETWRFPVLVGAAATVGNPRLVEVLLQAGADPNDGQSVLRAAMQERLDCLELLLDHGADLNAVCMPQGVPPLHWMLDFDYNAPGVQRLVDRGADPNLPAGPFGETALHVATRRRRVEAVKFLLESGADIDARTASGRTAYAHALCRGFDEVARLLAERGADVSLSARDELASALIHDRLAEARSMISGDRHLVPGMTVEEARILPDVAAWGKAAGLEILLDAGASIEARGLDGGTALHQAAWFGQPEVVKTLIQRGAPLETLCVAHLKTPLGWAAHGSRYSGGADRRTEVYVEIAERLLEAGASLVDPLHPRKDRKGTWLLRDAGPEVAAVLRRHGAALEPVHY